MLVMAGAAAICGAFFWTAMRLEVGVTSALARTAAALLIVTVTTSVAVLALVIVTVTTLDSVLVMVETSRTETTSEET